MVYTVKEGNSTGEEVDEHQMHKRCSIGEAMKEFKRSVRKTVRLTAKEEDEWIYKPSLVVRNKLKPLGIEKYNIKF